MVESRAWVRRCESRPGRSGWVFPRCAALRPSSIAAYSNLGLALRRQKKLTEAIAAFHKAIELDPKSAPAHSNLGIALADHKNLPEAIAAFHKAIELDPKSAPAYNNLAIALRDQKKLPEAIAAYHKAIELDPKYATAYNNLGIALHDQNKLPEAIAAHRKAIELDPKYALAYGSLGVALYDQKKLPEAIAAFHKAIELDPKSAPAYGGLGIALYDQKKLPEAIAAFHKAIELDPIFAPAYGALGFSFELAGKFSEAATAFQKAVDLLPPGAPLRSVTLSHLKQCRAMSALEKRVEGVLGGTDTATPAEILQMAGICQQYQKRFAVAVQLYRQAFKAQPGLAEDAGRPHRYNAACAAALAGTADAQEPTTTSDRPALRRQARDWLQADLDSCARQLKDGKAASILQVEARLAHWQTDPDFIGVREAGTLAKLPDAEQPAWRTLWANVDQLLTQVRALITETTLKGALTDTQHEQLHEMKLEAGKTYVIDMKSTDLDSYLKLHDPAGKLLAENDDIAPNNPDVRILFAPQADGVYRITATSFEQRGRGAYTLTIRAVAGKAH